MSITVSVTECSTTFSVVAADADDPINEATVPPPATSTPATMSASFFRMAPPSQLGRRQSRPGERCGATRRSGSAAEGAEELVQGQLDPVGGLQDPLERRDRLVAVPGDQGHGLLLGSDRARLPKALQHGHG